MLPEFIIAPNTPERCARRYSVGRITCKEFASVSFTGRSHQGAMMTVTQFARVLGWGIVGLMLVVISLRLLGIGTTEEVTTIDMVLLVLIFLFIWLRWRRLMTSEGVPN